MKIHENDIRIKRCFRWKWYYIDDRNPRIRGCEFYEKYISCDSSVPGESFKLSTRSSFFLGRPSPPLRLRAFARPNRRIAARCHCLCHHCHHCLPVLFWSHVSRAEAWLCLFFLGCWWNPQVSLLGLSLWLVTSFFSFCSHFGEARALPGDAVRPAGNQALNISPSQRILVWRYSRFPTLLPFRMQTMCHDYLCFRMIRILKKRLYLRVSNLQFWRGEGWFAISNKVQPWTHRQECLMGDVLFWLWGWVLWKHWNNSTDNVIPRLLASPCNRKAWKRNNSMCQCVMIKLQLWVPAACKPFGGAVHVR